MGKHASMICSFTWQSAKYKS